MCARSDVEPPHNPCVCASAILSLDYYMCLPDPGNTKTCIKVACDASATDGSFCAGSAAETGPVACAGLGLSGYEQTAYDMCCSTADASDCVRADGIAVTAATPLEQLKYLPSPSPPTPPPPTPSPSPPPPSPPACADEAKDFKCKKWRCKKKYSDAEKEQCKKTCDLCEALPPSASPSPPSPEDNCSGLTDFKNCKIKKCEKSKKTLKKCKNQCKTKKEKKCKKTCCDVS